MYVYYYMTILSLYDIERREGRREKEKGEGRRERGFSHHHYSTHNYLFVYTNFCIFGITYSY